MNTSLHNNETAIIFKQSPFQTDSGRDALDLAMVLATYDQPVSLFFKGMGVLQLTKNHNPDDVLKKDHTPTFKALELYDIENVYVSNECLQQFGLTTDDLNIDVSVLNTTAFYQRLNTYSTHLSF